MKPCRATPLSRRAGSRGVTLVELMIAVTIGLLLVVVLAQLFLGSRQTFATTDDVSRMQDNIRFSQILLARTIHLTGYKSQANAVTATVFQAFPALGAVDSPGTASDELIIRYQGSGNGSGTADGTVVDCLGARIDAGVMITNTFKIEKNASSGRMGLTCNGVEIVPDVLNMQIMFGEDLNADLVADRYVTPATVTTPPGTADQFLNVVSVRVSLLFETPTETSKATPDTQTYDMLSNGTVLLGPYADRRIRRLFVTTINLRNRTP